MAAAAAVSMAVGAGIGAVLTRPAASARLAGAPVMTPVSAAGSSAALPTTAAQTGVVDITTVLGYQNGSAAGTGIVLTSSGEILTNNHVVEGATSIQVQVGGVGRQYPARVVGTDKTDDLAVLQVQGAPKLATAKLGSSSSLAVGDAVTAVGNALGQGQLTTVTGMVQAVNQSITASDTGGSNAERLTGLIQTDAPLQPGDSGGPLLDRAGRVVGLDTAASAGTRFQTAAGVSFAIPIDKARAIARQIEAGQASSVIQIGQPALLGVQALSVADAQASGQYAAPVTSGAVVAGVAAGTPAQTAGLSPGDVIVSVGGRAVDSPSTLSALLQSHHAGDRVQIGWVDASGQRHTTTVQLVAGPAA